MLCLLLGKGWLFFFFLIVFFDIGFVCARLIFRVEVNVTLTTDMGDVISGLHRIEIAGESKFIESIQVAQVLGMIGIC